MSGRRAKILAILFSGTLAAAAFACGDDAEEDVTGKGSGGGGGDSGGAKDTGVVTTDDSSTPDPAKLEAGVDGGTCFSFAADAQGFALAGGAQHQAGKGVVLSLLQGTTATATRTFQTSGNIARSTITIDLTAQRDSAAWGSTTDDLVSVFSQHYGAGASETTAPTSLLYMTGNAFELKVWHAPNQLEGNHPLSATALGNAPASLSIATTWGATGTIDLAIDALTRTVTANTLSSAAGNTLTIVLGGKSTGSVPAYTLTVSRVCVDVQ